MAELSKLTAQVDAECADEHGLREVQLETAERSPKVDLDDRGTA